MPARSDARLDDIETGHHSLRIQYESGEIEVYYFEVEKGIVVPVEFNWTPLPPTATTTTVPTTTTTVPIRSSSGISLVHVEGGSFNMGSETGEADQKPLHRAALSAFFMSACEITVGQYRYFIQDSKYKPSTGAAGGMVWDEAGKKWDTKKDASWENPYLPTGAKQADDGPVVMVNWYDAAEYCIWLSRKEGFQNVYSIKGATVTADFTRNGYRLPTETEWEYAARGGRRSKEYLYAGSDNILLSGWHFAISGNSTHPVGRKSPNELGLYDMSGNVQEWCWDWYGEYTGSTQVDPLGSASGKERICRGGSWINTPSRCVTTFRLMTDPGIRCFNIGFRIVRRP